jgi:hypothetical protein
MEVLVRFGKVWMIDAFLEVGRGRHQYLWGQSWESVSVLVRLTTAPMQSALASVSREHQIEPIHIVDSMAGCRATPTKKVALTQMAGATHKTQQEWSQRLKACTILVPGMRGMADGKSFIGCATSQLPSPHLQLPCTVKRGQRGRKEGYWQLSGKCLFELNFA